MSRIDPRVLMSFRAVATHGSFAAAARDLGWTQPAISQHIRKLESDLNIALVVRTAKGVELTDAGARLLRHADAIDERLDRASRELATLGQSHSQTVRVVAFPSACAPIVAPVMSQLTGPRGGPQVHIELVQKDPAEVGKRCGAASPTWRSPTGTKDPSWPTWIANSGCHRSAGIRCSSSSPAAAGHWSAVATSWADSTVTAGCPDARAAASICSGSPARQASSLTSGMPRMTTWWCRSWSRGTCVWPCCRG